MINAMIQDNDLTDAQLEEITALQKESEEKLISNSESLTKAAESIQESENLSRVQSEAVAAHTLELQNLEEHS
jgi:hypothetical protein